MIINHKTSIFKTFVKIWVHRIFISIFFCDSDKWKMEGEKTKQKHKRKKNTETKNKGSK